MVLSQREKDESFKLLTDFLRLKTISATSEGIRETAEFLKDIMKSFGISARIIETGGHPVVFGEVGRGERSLIVYNHYDVQPVDPINEWKVDHFSATIINDRIYAKGSSDNKETLIARLYAIKSS